MIKGNGAAPNTLNQYIYCNNQPILYADLNGKSPLIPQYGNEIIWNQFLQDLNDTITARKIKRSQFINSVKEGWNNTINNIQTGLNNTVEEVKDSIGTKVEEIRDTLSKNNGTFTVKSAINANALFGIYADIGVSYDWKGNIAVQWSYAVPGVNDTSSVGILDAGFSKGIAFTNAEDVDELLGASSTIGASGGYLGYGTVDIISFEDMSDMNGDIDGIQIGAGAGVGLDVHLVETYTYEIFKYNQYDMLLSFLNIESECD